MTCKECLCYEVCQNKWAYSTFVNIHNKIYMEGMEKKCEFFKPQSRFVELPCEVGQTVWRTSGNYCNQEIYEGVVDQISIAKDGKILFWVYGHPLGFGVDDIGKTVFLSREEAEKTLQRKEDEGK